MTKKATKVNKYLNQNKNTKLYSCFFTHFVNNNTFDNDKIYIEQRNGIYQRISGHSVKITVKLYSTVSWTDFINIACQLQSFKFLYAAQDE